MLKNMSYSVIKFSENKKQYDADQKNDPRGDDKLIIIFKSPYILVSDHGRTTIFKNIQNSS